MSNLDIDHFVESLRDSYNTYTEKPTGFDTMVYECKWKGLQKALTNAYGSYYSTLIYEGKFDKIIPDLKFLKDVNTQIGENKTTEYIFITINPKSDISFEMFEEVISGKKQNLTNKKWMKDYIYCYEQRSEEIDEYKGYHLHMVLKRNNKKMFDIKKEFKNTLKTIMNVDNPNCLNFKNIRDEPDLKRRINYITNFKADSDKHKKQYNDVHFRKHYNLKRYYTTNDHYELYISNSEQLITVNEDEISEDEYDSDSSPSC